MTESTSPNLVLTARRRWIVLSVEAYTVRSVGVRMQMPVICSEERGSHVTSSACCRPRADSAAARSDCTDNARQAFRPAQGCLDRTVSALRLALARCVRRVLALRALDPALPRGTTQQTR